MLAIREVSQDRWSNFDMGGQSTPFGAGICVRKQVAQAYCGSLLNASWASMLDRKGNDLTSGGDIDMAWSSYQLKLATGLFAALKLTHLIPSARFQEGYLLRLAEGMSYSDVLLYERHGKTLTIPILSRWRRFLGRIKRQLSMSPRKRRFFEATLNGQQRAIKQLTQDRQSGLIMPAFKKPTGV
jgi:hypothetical protein